MPAFPAQWVTAYNALSPVSGFDSHRRLRDHSQAWSQHREIRTTRLCRPPGSRIAMRNQASIASSSPTSVATRVRPLLWAGWMHPTP